MTGSSSAVSGQQTGSGIKRVLTRRDLIFFGLVILTPTAPYPVYGIIQQVSWGHAALSYLVAMVAMLFTAASYARMAVAYPSAGSTYTYVQQTIGPFIGFLAGWAMILDYFLIPLESVIYAAITAARLLPAIPYFAWVFLFTAAVTLVNVRGIRLMACANTAMMIVMTGCALLFIGFAVHNVAVRFGIAYIFSPRALVQSESLALQPLMLGAGIATLSYIGFDAISTLAEDTIDPRRDIGFSTIFVCVLQTLICVLTVYLASLVWSNYHSFPEAETAILDIGRRAGGAFLFALITFVLLVAGLASALTGQAGVSRLLFAMGRDRVIPASVFSYIHPRHGTPTRAIWVVSGLTLTGALFIRFQSAVELLNFGAFVGFILVNVSVIYHYFIRLHLRKGKYLLENLFVPLCGASVCCYVWMNLSDKAKVMGFLWLGIGGVYLCVLTRGFRRVPTKLEFER
ncbi:MAG TPA: amino acid permease [Bryobacteraceae bacterium]|jgi:amino acid transporter|nr:amino acid permease [Bryobacteraceae bacterium]